MNAIALWHYLTLHSVVRLLCAEFCTRGARQVLRQLSC
jgi:hypothetical protein